MQGMRVLLLPSLGLKAGLVWQLVGAAAASRRVGEGLLLLLVLLLWQGLVSGVMHAAGGSSSKCCRLASRLGSRSRHPYPHSSSSNS
jgi:hypothetical protein